MTNVSLCSSHKPEDQGGYDRPARSYALLRNTIDPFPWPSLWHTLREYGVRITHFPITQLRVPVHGYCSDVLLGSLALRYVRGINSNPFPVK